MKLPLRSYLTAARVRAISIAGLLLISTSAGFLGGWLGASSRDHQSNLDRQAQQIVSSESQLISSIAETVGESVVSINVVSVESGSNYFGTIRSYEQESAGTGIILTEDGIIITNRHVIPEGVTEVAVVLSDGTELENVEVIGRTAENDSLDVAFLKVSDTEGKQLKAATIGDSSKVNVGDKVVAIGNALGQFQNTVTQGIISGFGRSVIAGDSVSTEQLQNLFQTDAAINQGNSGGPLVNMNGEVIGINTAIAGGAENIGFSIPINDTKGLIASVLEKGVLERPYIGVRYLSLTDDYAEEFGVEVKRGAYIVPEDYGQPSIIPDSPAERAGLRSKDVITEVNGEAISENNSLTSLVSKYQVGEEITLTIHRDGQDQEVKVTLEAQS